MRKNIVLLALLLPLLAGAQINVNIPAVVTGRFSPDMKEGDSVRITEVRHETGSVAVGILLENQEGVKEAIYHNQLSRLALRPQRVDEYWQHAALQEDALRLRVRKGAQHALRQSLAEEATDYLRRLESDDLLYKDLFLETYLSKLANRIYPTGAIEDWDEVLRVKIIKDRLPHVEAYPGGLLFISTGMLSALESEEELMAILSTEVAHLVLDHAVRNINAAVARERRAAFWSGLATLAAATTEVYAASQDPYYVPGDLTMSVAELSSEIAYSINARLGVSYPNKQRLLADKYAAGYLGLIGLGRVHLANAFKHVHSYLIRIGRQDAIYLEDNNTKLSWNNRRGFIGATDTVEVEPGTYHQQMAPVHQFNARLAHHQGDWKTAKALILRNIKHGFETPESYQMLALAMMHQDIDEKQQKEVLRLIERGLKVDPQAYYLYKLQGVAFLDLKAKSSARTAFEQYREGLNLDQEYLPNIRHPEEWSRMNRFLQREQQWTQNILWRLGLEGQ